MFRFRMIYLFCPFDFSLLICKRSSDGVGKKHLIIGCSGLFGILELGLHE